MMIVEGDAPTDITLDMAKFVKANDIENCKISVRSLDGVASECSFWLYDVTGLSNVYSSSQLSDLIIRERDKVRHPDEMVQDGNTLGNLALAIALIVASAVLGMGVFVAFRRDDRNIEDTTSE